MQRPKTTCGANPEPPEAGAFMSDLDDIEFESTAFSSRFVVKSRDSGFVHDLLDQRLMTFMLETDPPSIEIEGDRICIFGSRPWGNSEFRARLDWMGRFLERWPPHLMERLSGAGS